MQSKKAHSVSILSLPRKKSNKPISQTHRTQGREGLSGPSKLGVNPTGEYNVTVTLGGGYYFVPPIPGKDLTRISEQFFRFRKMLQEEPDAYSLNCDL